MLCRKNLHPAVVAVALAALGTLSTGCRTLRFQGPERRAPRRIVFVPRPDLRRQLQGKWIIHAAHDSQESGVWTIRDNRIEADGPEGQRYKGTFAIDDRTRPVEIDITLTTASDASLVGKTIKGIMRLRGDSVRFCISEPGARGRPQYFDSAQGRLYIGRRQ